jgi:hypothetical protein
VTSSDPAKKFAALLKRARGEAGEASPAAAPEAPAGEDIVVNQLVFSLLMWEATATLARAGFKKLRAAFVDYNELRVALAHEIAHALGPGYPKAEERAMRLRSALNDVFRREHTMSLAKLADAGKRESRAYLETLDGLPAYAAARVGLVCLGGGVIPVDERLRVLLVRERALEDETTLEVAAAWLDKQVKESGDCLAAHVALQAWADAEPMFETQTVAPKPVPPPKAAPPAKPSTRPKAGKSQRGGRGGAASAS